MLLKVIDNTVNVFYFSMPRNCNLISSATLVLLGISLVCYLIEMCVGWTLFTMVYPRNSLILTAAIVSTIPTFSAIFILYSMISTCCYDFADVKFLLFSIASIEIFAALFEVIGGILFIVTGVTVDNSKLFAAGVLGIIAGFTCIGSQLSCFSCLLLKDNEDYTRTNFGGSNNV